MKFKFSYMNKDGEKQEAIVEGTHLGWRITRYGGENVDELAVCAMQNATVSVVHVKWRVNDPVLAAAAEFYAPDETKPVLDLDDRLLGLDNRFHIATASALCWFYEQLQDGSDLQEKLINLDLVEHTLEPPWLTAQQDECDAEDVSDELNGRR